MMSVETKISQTTGIIVGKFMPPHQGHRYLVDSALSFVDALWVFVCSLPGEPIPGELRYNWMKELFPQATVIHIQEVNPHANRNQPGAQNIWANAVRQYVNKKIDYVFASEAYGWEFANALNARFVPVDPSRDQFPISGTELRDRPFRNWHFIPHVVKPFFVKEILVDPRPFSEDIIHRTAMLLNTLYVPSYRTFYYRFAQNHPEEGIVAPAQEAQRHALKMQARYFLLRTYDPEVANSPADCYLACHESSSPIAFDFTREADRHLMQVSHIQCTAETAPHMLRDAILDNWRHLL